MKVPNADNAFVLKPKVAGYLLDIDHVEGHDKARFFLSFGFRPSRWEEFANALLVHCRRHDVIEIERTPYGIKYAIIGILETPDGRNPEGVRSVWQIDHGADRPRLVSAYPDSSRRR